MKFKENICHNKTKMTNIYNKFFSEIMFGKGKRKKKKQHKYGQKYMKRQLTWGKVSGLKTYEIGL